MTEDFRQKLLNWVSSVILVVALTTLSAALTWFLIVPSPPPYYWPPTTMADTAGPLSRSLLVYLILFGPIFFWHLFDFLQAGRPDTPLMHAFSSYAPFALFLSAGGVALVLLSLGFFFGSCPALEEVPENTLLRTCFSAWGEILGVTLLIGTVALCFGKAVTMLHSRFR